MQRNGSCECGGELLDGGNMGVYCSRGLECPEHKKLMRQIFAPRPDRGSCSYCHGNDRNMPCAYPSEGKPGCLRDARLAAELPP